MSETVTAKGSCLCGSVQLSTSTMTPNIGVCHCGMCRKWGSGPFMGLDCSQDLKIEGEDSVSIYNSSDWAERAFCKKCGTNLFYRLKANSQYIVAAGIFADQKFNFDHQVFIDEKPEYYDFSNQTKNMTGAEVFAAFAPESN